MVMIDLDHTVRVKATIGGHEEYKGVKQTTIKPLVVLERLTTEAPTEVCG